MLRALLPECVAVVSTSGQFPPSTLFLAEKVQMQGAVASRLMEFATGRYCARQALQRLGLPPTAILIGSDRAPIWPTGIIGSITHCSRFCAAVVCRQSNLSTLGIDAEPHESLPSELLEQICVGEEQRWLSRAPGGICWDRVIFSAKESVYKAWFQLTREWLGFEEATILFNLDKGTFSAEIHAEALHRSKQFVRSFPGRYYVSNQLILTTVAL